MASNAKTEMNPTLFALHFNFQVVQFFVLVFNLVSCQNLGISVGEGKEELGT